MWSILVDDYFTSSLAIFIILVEILLSFQRYLILINKAFLLNVFKCYFKVSSGLFLFALVYYLPFLFRKNILESQINYYSANSSTLFETIKVFSIIETSFGNSSLGGWITVALAAVRIVLGTVVLTAINIVNAIKFKNILNKKFKIKATTRARGLYRM